MKLLSIAVVLIFTNSAYANSPGANVHNCSGTIQLASVAQNAISAKTTLHGFQIGNVSNNSNICFSFTGPAGLGTNNSLMC